MSGEMVKRISEALKANSHVRRGQFEIHQENGSVRISGTVIQGLLMVLAIGFGGGLGRRLRRRHPPRRLTPSSTAPLRAIAQGLSPRSG